MFSLDFAKKDVPVVPPLSFNAGTLHHCEDRRFALFTKRGGQAPDLDREDTLSKRRQKDVDARWSKKHRTSYSGYKLAAGADKRYKFIRKIKISAASEHDTLHVRR
ncbi:transposase [Duganella sp. CY42W]|uniref:Transposase n=2 Tax=Duganella levis TaxID=2692169 RepID=A0ABW9W969_9BURK|nr:transposase [Duganella levis]